jgi:hypothetical protein
MHGWPWCFEQTAVRRDQLGATMILATFGFVLGAWIALGTYEREEVDDADAHAHAEAASVATAIRELADERGGCSEALAHLPVVQPAASLRADPWGKAWSIRCHGDLAVVRSAGADGEFGAEDDIVEVAVTRSKTEQ